MKTTLKEKCIIFFLLVLIVFGYLLVNNEKEKTFTATYTEYLDTVCEITLVSKTDEPLIACEEYLQFAEKEFSAEDENSTLFKLNNQDNILPSANLFDAISRGNEFSKKHPDFFSIYLDDTIKLWNISENPESVPSNDDIRKSLEVKNINLGGIAKGYITDQLVQKLYAHNVTSALINLGGNTYAIGKKSTGENWKIGIQDPKDENKIIGYITVEDTAVVTSGDYQRYAEIGGKRYHHILDPKTGYPVENGVHSVTVICSDATAADALSTTAFVAGIEEGNKILKEYNAMGIFITDDTIYLSKELENIFTQFNASYKYELLH